MSQIKPEKESELLDMIKSLSRAKGIEEEWVFQAMESALAKVTAKRYENQFDVRIVVDRKTGYFATFKQQLVVEDETFDPDAGESQIKFSELDEASSDLEVGDTYEQPMESIEFGRIDAHSAKQTIIKEVRDAERRHLVAKFQDTVGTLINGVVKKVTREHIILDLGDNVEAMLSRSETVSNESFRINDRVRAYLYDAHDVHHINTHGLCR